MKTIAEISAAAVKALKDSGKEMPFIAAASAADASTLASLAAAKKQGLGNAVLIGNKGDIERTAKESNIDISGFEILHEPSHSAAAAKAAGLVREGKAQLPMKGLVETAIFLKAVMKKEGGLNTGKLISHVGVVESAFYPKLLFISDGALNIAPTLNEKIGIIENAVGLARDLGIPTPKVAVLAALEQVNPERMPCTADAAILTQMNRRGRIANCIVDGPLALDNAVHPASARIKGIDSPIAADADILITPSIEAGNMLFKSIMYLGNAKGAGILLGAKAPVILSSRASDAETRLASIALAVLNWVKEGV
ncbi:bifunctional enoyl-CoA hydratase/phosphate acetyltransferase [Leadbettera azotonutricia]|uniref:Phosphate acetyltransferase n=1 Tax=Leadbettera azotonutricia (strain ATCC BAA-888 / DSM 13862 / ZAS-9) TaxID=545695 RepID=F5YBZ7_LEAAZ|nr:bifunctional enoyl-CoA hydratase/phosphate acetyltransferase [Leadbettera azotonutricia]AEF83260.1 phosphate acetyltransferase [Leadbettera azotonutricia ZAS-9]